MNKHALGGCVKACGPELLATWPASQYINKNRPRAWTEPPRRPSLLRTFGMPALPRLACYCARAVHRRALSLLAAIVHPRSRARAHAGDDRQALGEFLPQGVLLERPMLARVIEDCLALRRAQHARDVRTTCVRHMPCARYVHSMRLAYTRHWRETRDVCSRSVTYARHTCGDATKAVKCGLVSRPVVTSLTMRRSREKSTRSPGADAHGVVQGCTLPG